MKKNMGLADRIIRLLIAIFLMDVAVNAAIGGGWRIIAWALAGILLITSLAARCPLYTLLHFHTNKIPDSTLKNRQHE